MTRTGIWGQQAGFTLIEMLVALAILAAAAVVAMPLTRNAATAQALRTTGADIAAVARMTRAAALRSGAERTMVIDIDGRTYSSDGVAPPRALPSQFGIDLTVPPGEQLGRGASRIRFLPDGGSSGGKVVLRDGARTTVVTIDWLTGGASVATP